MAPIFRQTFNGCFFRNCRKSGLKSIECNTLLMQAHGTAKIL